jgi:DNA polymerase-3 subunit delta'
LGFSEIVGHKEIIRALDRALFEQKVGHAYLFLGSPRIGKKTLAKVFANRLLCDNQPEAECNGCRSCVLFKAGSHPDFITVVPNGSSIKIEQLRELQRSTYFRPLTGTYKVFFFPDAEQLTEAAANSFLKLLEEPPAGVVFLFIAVRGDRILATIRSRCQVYNLFPVPGAEINLWLQDKGFEAEEALQRSLNCEGIPGKALMLKNAPVDPERIEFKKILDQDLLQQLKFTNDLEKRERQDILILINDWENQARQNLIRTSNGDSPDWEDFGLGWQLNILEKLARAKLMIENNVNPRLVLEEFFLNVAVQSYGGY